MILNNNTKKQAKDFFEEILDVGINFKLQEKTTANPLTFKEGKRMISKIPQEGKSLEKVLGEFKEKILPYCTNFSSKNFMGFPDAGNSVAALGASILYNFLQQNLINQSFCGPSATFVEIAVIQWLREIVGYKNKKVHNIWDVGGIITPGGTSSNTIGIMLAREQMFPGAMQNGTRDLERSQIIVPKGIGHYSVKSAQMWTGCGNRLIEAETQDFCYDLKDLKKKLGQNKGKVMCVVVYVGDSRTMTVDHLDDIVQTVRSFDPKIWLHADACHGFCLGFSDKLRYIIKGLNEFDSISTDPHKVLMTPYTISALLVKDPGKFKTITSLSDLIMQEEFAFGQITPFLGSRPWHSLKLWFLIKNLGRKRLGKIIEKRHELAEYLASRLQKNNNFILFNKVGINAVCFMYKGDIDVGEIDKLNDLNKKIHKTIVKEGKFYIHQFSIPDSGKIKKGEIVYPLRYMSGNPNTAFKDIDNLISYIENLGRNISKDIR